MNTQPANTPARATARRTPDSRAKRVADARAVAASFRAAGQHAKARDYDTFADRVEARG